jgi:hypothetical protein
VPLAREGIYGEGLNWTDELAVKVGPPKKQPQPDVADGKGESGEQTDFQSEEARAAAEAEEEELKMHMVIESLEAAMEITKYTTMTKARLRRRR